MNVATVKFEDFLHDLDTRDDLQIGFSGPTLPPMGKHTQAAADRAAASRIGRRCSITTEASLVAEAMARNTSLANCLVTTNSEVSVKQLLDIRGSAA